MLLTTKARLNGREGVATNKQLLLFYCMFDVTHNKNNENNNMRLNINAHCMHTSIIPHQAGIYSCSKDSF